MTLGNFSSKIGSVEEMSEFCDAVNSKGVRFNVYLVDAAMGLSRISDPDGLAKHCASLDKVNRAKKVIDDLTQSGEIPPRPISEIVQGISQMDFSNGKMVVTETPVLYPRKVIETKAKEFYPGPMTGNLTNCYGPKKKVILFQMRSGNAAKPFKFQGAAAGFGCFGENPGVTAARELKEEAGIENAFYIYDGRAIDCISFPLKVDFGEEERVFPQPEFSYGFTSTLDRYAQPLKDFDYEGVLGVKRELRTGPLCRTMDDVLEFEGKMQAALKKTGAKPEACHFTVPYDRVERVAGAINERADNANFHGPIFESTIKFMKALRDGNYVSN